jgi:hypothetical protein
VQATTHRTPKRERCVPVSSMIALERWHVTEASAGVREVYYPPLLTRLPTSRMPHVGRPTEEALMVQAQWDLDAPVALSRRNSVRQ